MGKVIGLDFETALSRFTPRTKGKGIVIGTHVPISFQLYSKDVKLNPKSGNPYVFSPIPDLLEKYVCRRTSGSIFVSANLAFDVAVLSKILQNKNYTITCFYAKNRPIKVTIQDNYNRKWKVIDIFNIYGRIGLARIGKTIGLQKMEKPKWLGIRPPQNEAEWEQLKNYGIRDAEIHYCAFKKITEFWGITPTTAGNLALTHFKKSTGLDLRFPCYKEEVIKKLAQAYRGGRSESFIRGSIFGKVYYYDINGMYPFVMKTYPYPYVSKEKDGMYVHKYNVDLDKEGIAKALVYQDSNIPPLGAKRPVKISLGKSVKIENRLVFPKGHVLDWFTYPELRYLEDTGHGFIIKIYESYEWQNKWNPFKTWVSNLEKIREEQPELKYLVKIPMNSLYGKLGEKRNSKILTVKEGKVIKMFPDYSSNLVYAKHSCLPLACYITAYSRLYLHQFIIKSNYEVFYCDTDSIFTAKTLPLGKKLGELGLKYETENDAHSIFVRSKFYVCGDLVRCRGWNRPPPAVAVKALLLNGKIEIDQTEFASLLQALRLHVPVLAEIKKKKIITTGEDGKRVYDKHLDGKELLLDMTESCPLEIKEGWF